MTTTAFTDGVTLSAAAWFNDVDAATYSGLSSVTGTNTVLATGPAGMSAYGSGKTFKFVPAFTNTSTVTINLTCNGTALGSRAVTKQGATPLDNGDLVSTTVAFVVDDGTRFQLLNPQTSVVTAATQAQQESGASTSIYVSPGRQQFHPSAAKAWAQADFAGASIASYNLTSITDTGGGDIMFNWNVDFSGSAYCALATVILNAGGTAATSMFAQIKNSLAAGTTAVNSIRMSDFVPADATYICCAVFGDQP